MHNFKVKYILDNGIERLEFNSEKEACNYFGVRQTTISAYNEGVYRGYKVSKIRPDTSYDYSNERLTNIYHHIRRRCTDKNNKDYKNYGGRGIKVCDEWLNNPRSFTEWALSNGYNDNLTIDRINVNGNYEPSNCRWVTIIEQNRNKRNSHNITINGEIHNCKEWSEISGISYSTIRTRFYAGWSPEDLLLPVGSKPKSHPHERSNN